MSRGKEIEIPSTRPVPHEDPRIKSIVFEYNGRPSEISDFVNRVREAGLSCETPGEQLINGILQFKMTIPRGQFDKFMTILRRWKIDI